MRITESGFRLTEETCNSLDMNIEQRRMGVIIGILKSDAGTFDLANEEKLNTREAGEILGIPPEIVRKLIHREWLSSTTRYNFIKQLHDGYLLRKEDVLKVKPQLHHIIITMLKQMEMNIKMGRMKAAKTKEEKAFIYAQILGDLNTFPIEEITLHKVAFYLKQLETISNRQFEKYFERMRPIQLSAYKWMQENAKDFFTVFEYNVAPQEPGEEGHREYAMNIYTFSQQEPLVMFRLFPPGEITNIIPREEMKTETVSINNFTDLYKENDTYVNETRYQMSWKSPLVSPRIAMRELKKLMMPPRTPR